MVRRNRKGEAVATTSADFLAEQIARLKGLFPEAFTEGKVDFDRFHATLGDLVDDGPERYTFTWAGKRDAIRLLQTPTRATLVPCREESVDFDETQHIFIEGDNLEVLKLLYKPYFGRVKMIYIDPPYNTGKEFIYPDNYTDPLATYLQLTGQQDAEGNLLTSNPETSGRYHSSWLSMMYPRLFLARQLLREDGVIFVSIDDHEVHNLRMLMNEVFGEENFVSNIVWQKKFSPQSDARYLSDNHDHILLYARQKDRWQRHLLPVPESVESRYSNPDHDPRGPWSSGDLSVKTYNPAYDYPITTPSGRVVYPSEGRCWAVSKERLQELIADNRIWFGKSGNNVPRLKQFRSEVQPGMVPVTVWLHEQVGHNQEATQELKRIMNDVETVFDTPKPVRLVKQMLRIATETGSDCVVLDFFAGSCTTAQAVLELNREDRGSRRFIGVQLPEPTGKSDFATVADLGKERIRRVIAEMRRGNGGQSAPETREAPPEDLGLKVFKLAPSNYRPWVGVNEATPDAYAQQMALFADPLVEGWTAESVIYEVALKEGYGLNCRIEPISPSLTSGGTGVGARATVYRVTDPDKEQRFAICLDDAIGLENFSAVSLEKDDLFVCRDAALDDETAANLALRCRLITI